MRGKGLIDIYILEILERFSSQKKRLRQTDIIRYLEEEYNVEISRNTLSGYLFELREQGYIDGNRGVFVKRRFSNTEIALLINSILYSKSIPVKNIKDMIQKLRVMAEPDAGNRLRNFYFVDEFSYTDNENVFEVIERIDEAIDKRRKIEILGCTYNFNGQLVESTRRCVDPYYIVVEKSRYYLLCFAGREDIEPRRIARIKEVRILEENRVEINQIPKYNNHTFRVAEYMKEHIYMYSGESARIKLKIKKDKIGDFIDWFGKDFKLMQQNEEEMIVKIKANTKAVYFWALQYGSIAEILEPIDLREEIYLGAQEIAHKHKKRLDNQVFKTATAVPKRVISINRYLNS